VDLELFFSSLLEDLGVDSGFGLAGGPPAVQDGDWAGMEERDSGADVRSVLQYFRMSHTLTIRLTEELLVWLRETSQRTGIPVGRIVRQQLESAKEASGQQKFLRHLGRISGPPDLSSRKGFSRR
jgi:hypothetical protein